MRHLGGFLLGLVLDAPHLRRTVARVLDRLDERRRIHRARHRGRVFGEVHLCGRDAVNAAQRFFHRGHATGTTHAGDGQAEGVTRVGNRVQRAALICSSHQSPVTLGLRWLGSRYPSVP